LAFLLGSAAGLEPAGHVQTPLMAGTNVRFAREECPYRRSCPRAVLDPGV